MSVKILWKGLGLAWGHVFLLPPQPQVVHVPICQPQSFSVPPALAQGGQEGLTYLSFCESLKNTQSFDPKCKQLHRKYTGEPDKVASRSGKV